MKIVQRSKSVLRSFIYSDGVNTLPIKIMIPLFFLMLCNSMTITMPFSFLPKLVKMFGTSEVAAGTKVGLLGAALYFGKIFSSFIWGMLADTYGRKRLLLITGFLSAFSFTLFGFSFTYWWAFGMRFLQGLSGGIPIISRALVMEETDSTNRNLAMSIIFGTISLGYIIGPSVGGFLAFPHLTYPELFKKDSIAERFPVLLPVSIIAIGMYIVLACVSIFIPGYAKKNFSSDDEENCSEKNGFSEITLNVEKDGKKRFYKLKMTHYGSLKTVQPYAATSRLKKILRNKTCLSICFMYALYSFVSISYNEILPVYAATTHDYHGFGFTPANLGLLLTIIAVLSIIIQFTVFSRVLDRLGLKNCFIICCMIQGFLYPCLPLCEMIKNREAFWAALIIVTFSIRISLSLAFVAANILVNNSVDASLLASANGLCATAGTIGRLIGVPVAGAIYSWSLTNERIKSNQENKMGFPFNHYFVFFVLSVGAFLNMFIAYFLPNNLNKKRRVEDENIT